MKIAKSRQETVKPKKLLRHQPVQSLGIGDSRTLTMPCMAFCVMIPKRRLLSLEGKPSNFTIMRSREHCIADRMTGSSSAACHERSHRKYSKKRTMACVGSSARSETRRLTPKAGILLAYDDFGRHHLCQTMPRLSSPWRFHPASTRISSLYNLYLAI